MEYSDPKELDGYVDSTSNTKISATTCNPAAAQLMIDEFSCSWRLSVKG
jgi:hypothetical protein